MRPSCSRLYSNASSSSLIEGAVVEEAEAEAVWKNQVINEKRKLVAAVSVGRVVVNMASWLNAMRITIQVIGSLFQLVAIGLILTALLTPAWQEVYFSMESQTFHQHGLWLDCVQSQRSGIVHAAGSGGWSCSYKFNAKQAGKEGSAHAPKTWQIITLSLLSGGGLFSLIGLFISYCICCPRMSAVLWAITNTFAAFTTAAGIIVFFRMSQAVENRIVIELTESYE
ncbi:Clc-like protein [Trichinella nativa]|uniref:Clc-like protein n=1 Tax=Trichinella nativa TaxID=6335 RepID=A0A1Y3EHT0_9BILA|nr:Clc-like protein [Trichinella nativa]